MTAPLVLEKPVRHQNVFAEDVRGKLYEYLLKKGWDTGWKSNGKRDGTSFLHKHFAGWRKKDGVKPPVYDCEGELQQNSPLIFDAWVAVRDKIFAGHKLVRCYANGMAYGMDGTVHADAHEPGNYTAVYYPHERWSPNWGGETIFYNQQESGIVSCCYPRPNSIVVFDGRMPHRANGVTRSYTGMRITLMWKVMKDEEYERTKGLHELRPSE